MNRNRLADMLTGAEFGYRCAEKGMNLQETMAAARKILTADDNAPCICRKGSVFVNPKCAAKEHRP